MKERISLLISLLFIVVPQMACAQEAGKAGMIVENITDLQAINARTLPPKQYKLQQADGGSLIYSPSFSFLYTKTQGDEVVQYAACINIREHSSGTGDTIDASRIWVCFDPSFKVKFFFPTGTLNIAQGEDYYLYTTHSIFAWVKYGIVDMDGNVLLEDEWEHAYYSKSLGLVTAYNINEEKDHTEYPFLIKSADKSVFVEKALVGPPGPINVDHPFNAAMLDFLHCDFSAALVKFNEAAKDEQYSVYAVQNTAVLKEIMELYPSL